MQESKEILKIAETAQLEVAMWQGKYKALCKSVLGPYLAGGFDVAGHIQGNVRVDNLLISWKESCVSCLTRNCA